MEKDEVGRGEAGTCSICFEEYDVALHLPRLLHCGHSFCTQCLTDLVSSSTPQHSITCPRCRALTRLGLGGFGGGKPDDAQGVQALPRNFDLLDVLTQMTATTNNKPTTCEAHKGKRLKYWCDQDDTAVCTSCLLIGAHRGHKAVPIDEAAIKATTQARADVTLLEANLGRINEALAEVEARSDNARERAASSRIAVHKHFAWLKAVLAQREDELEKELRAWEDQRAHAMQQDHSKLSKVKQELEVACELMQAIVTHPSVNLLAASGEVSRRRATALKAREAASPHLLKPFGGRAKVCEESIAFQADECSARKAIHGAMLSIQSAGDKKEIEQDGDSSDYLELNVVVYRDLKLWHQADLWGPELVLFPFASALPPSLPLVTDSLRAVCCVA
jgi:ribosomal protein S27E